MCMIKHDAAFLCATWLCSGNNISELYEQLELFVICVNGCTDLPDITKLTLKCYTVCIKKQDTTFIIILESQIISQVQKI